MFFGLLKNGQILNGTLKIEYFRFGRPTGMPRHVSIVNIFIKFGLNFFTFSILITRERFYQKKLKTNFFNFFTTF